jgi:lysophospholipase L1-like esterase
MAGNGGSSGGSNGGAGLAGSESGGNGGGSAGGGPGFDPCPAASDCKVLPLGDSITFGTPTNNGGYRVELFSKALADGKHMTFVGSQMNGPAMVAGKPFPKNNEGYPGWTITQIDGIANDMKALKDAPHIVLLHIGTNDMYQGANGAPMRLGELIDAIVTVLPNSLLAVSSIIPFPGSAGAVDTYNEAVPGVVQERASAGKHVIYVDQFKDFPTSELADGVHPNDTAGYPRMGRVWYAAIKPYLH